MPDVYATIAQQPDVLVERLANDGSFFAYVGDLTMIARRPRGRTIGAGNEAPGLRCVLVADPDALLLDALRAGDEVAFTSLVSRHHTRLLRLAESLVRSRAVAEEVVQDTWLGVVRGIDRFEGRSSVKTWLFRILVNRARSAGVLESRTASVGDDALDALEGRFDASGAWGRPPEPWPDAVDDRLVAESLAARVRECLPALPPAQRQVLVLRDVEGLDTAEVCQLLSLTPGNQRVLLHRARARLRSLIDADVDGS